MSELEVLLEYKGSVTFEAIDKLLERLRKLPAYMALNKSARKRIYCIFVECIENIYKYSITDSVSVNDEKFEPYINLSKQDNKYIIDAGNVVTNKSIHKLRSRLERLNQLDKPELKASYADIINKEFISDEEGAGLGLIIIALRAENKINYNFTSLGDKYSYFEMKISV